MRWRRQPPHGDWIPSTDHRNRMWSRPGECCSPDDGRRAVVRIVRRGICRTTMLDCGDRRERLQCDGRDPCAWAISSEMIRDRSMSCRMGVRRRRRTHWRTSIGGCCSSCLWLAEEMG